MANISQFVTVGFTLRKTPSLAIFFSNVGYLCTASASDFVTGYVVPTDKVISIATIEGLKEVFNADTQYYKDIETLLTQKGNLRPNKSGVNEVIVYVGSLASGQDYGSLVDEFISVNANFARLTIDSRSVSDILAAARKAQANDVRFIAQTSSSSIADDESNNIADQMNALELDLVDLDFHSADAESLATADGAVATQEIMGSVGDLYSQFTNVSPKKYTETEESNFNRLNVSYYTTVGFKDGGSLDNYAQKVLLGGKTITGEDRKRRDIRYYFDNKFKNEALAFLTTKPAYTDGQANILNQRLTALLLEGQNNNLIVPDSIDENGNQVKGFQIRPIYPSDMRKSDVSSYNERKFKEVGYYYDAITGRTVDIDFVIDPKDYDIAALGF